MAETLAAILAEIRAALTSIDARLTKLETTPTGLLKVDAELSPEAADEIRSKFAGLDTLAARWLA